MTLYLTDHTETARALRKRLTMHADPNASGVARGETSTLRRLPTRLVAASAFAGWAIANELPEVVVVVAALALGNSAAPGIIYRLELADEAWLPDVTYRHAGEAQSLAAAAPWGPATARRELPAITPSGAGALAGALSMLSPHQVVGVTTTDGHESAAVELATSCASRAADTERAARRRRTGGGHVEESIRMGGALADRLRLTATQRAEFLNTVRGAAVRGGSVPAPLTARVDDTSETRAITKAEAKRRLAELARLLDAWGSDEA